MGTLLHLIYHQGFVEIIILKEFRNNNILRKKNNIKPVKEIALIISENVIRT